MSSVTRREIWTTTSWSPVERAVSAVMRTTSCLSVTLVFGAGTCDACIRRWKKFRRVSGTAPSACRLRLESPLQLRTADEWRTPNSSLVTCICAVSSASGRRPTGSSCSWGGGSPLPKRRTRAARRTTAAARSSSPTTPTRTALILSFAKPRCCCRSSTGTRLDSPTRPRRLLGERHERQRLRGTAARSLQPGSSSPMTRSRAKTRRLSRRRLRGMTYFCASTRTISTFTGSSEGPSGTTTIYPTTTCPGGGTSSTGDSRWLTKRTRMKTSTERTAMPISTTGAGRRGPRSRRPRRAPEARGKGAEPSAYPSGAGLEEESSAGTSPRRAGRQPRRRVHTAASWASEPSQCRESTNPSRPQRWAARGRHCRWRTPPARFRAATSNARKLLTLWSSPLTLVRSVWAGVCTSRVFQARARRRRCAKSFERFARNPGTDRCPGSITWNSTVSVCRHPSTRTRRSRRSSWASVCRRRLQTMSWIGDSRRAGAATGASLCW
mmetsp:Transcript_11928/g.46274  ORF Transcript_11928/g.46274 Transcript_11928/m.46274 type:complete len:495 (+) Transcript_11928:451-1935(+)